MVTEARELQLLASAIYSVEDTRKVLDEFVDFMRTLPDQIDVFIPTFAEFRKLKESVLNEIKSFMMNPDIPYNSIPDKYKQDSFGIYSNNRNLFNGRFVLPVYDIHGHVAGFCGYDMEGNPKYLDSLNYGYKAKHCGFFGMQYMPDYYDRNELIICEGPMCMLYMIGEGLPAVSSLGSKPSNYMYQIARRFGTHCLVIPDGCGDEAGLSYRRNAERNLPLARVVQPTKAKDIDDTRKLLLESGESRGNEIIANELQQLLRDPFYESEFFV